MLSVVSAILISCVTPASADEVELTPGTLVRITKSGTRLKGILQAMDSRSLTVVLEGQRVPTRLDRSTMSRLEVGAPRSVGAGLARGAGRGLLIGGGAGLILGAVNGGWEGAAVATFLGGVPAALIGAGIGAAEPGVGWKTVTAASRVTIGPAPLRDGVGVAISLSF